MFECGDRLSNIIDESQVIECWVNGPRLSYILKDGTGTANSADYESEKESRAAQERLKTAIKNTGGNKVPKGLSEYLEKHSDILYTIALVLVLDHLILKGKFRSKIEEALEGFLNKNLQKVS